MTILGSYRVLSTIAQGGTSMVYKVNDVETGESLALKVTPFSHVSKTIWENEISVLKKFQYTRGIIKMWDYWQTSDHGYMVMELCDGDLCEEPVTTITEQQRLFLFLLHVFKSIHGAGYCYNDLKIENVLRKGQGFRLCDFSSCLPIGTTSKTLYGTPTVMAPEMIQSFHQHRTYYYDEKNDSWGFGTLMYEVITGYPVYSIPAKLSLIQTLSCISRQKIDFSRVENVMLRRVLEKCLCPDPQTRIRIWEIERELRL